MLNNVFKIVRLQNTIHDEQACTMRTSSTTLILSPLPYTVSLNADRFGSVD